MKADKELYRRLRVLTCDQLRNHAVVRFGRATPKERLERVAVIRAVGVVFTVRAWLQGLLQDPAEKIRRYAMAALPKIGAGVDAKKTFVLAAGDAGGAREKNIWVGRSTRSAVRRHWMW
jgi:hypothetical protein